VLECGACDIRIEANFVSNEFASLDDDDLHFLRIFIHTEGRIREMESALGVSYPTVKARLAELKEKLQIDSPPPPRGHDDQDEVSQTLRDLERGRISYEQAIGRLKGRQERTG